MTGPEGFIAALVQTCETVGLKISRAEIRAAVELGAPKVKQLLSRLLDAAAQPMSDSDPAAKAATVIIAVDQGEELFLNEGRTESEYFIGLLHDLLAADAPAVIAIFTIRSENYEQLQQTQGLADIHKIPLDLGHMPKGSYVDVVKGPIRRLSDTSRALKIEDALVDTLLADIEAGAAKDALPLLSFTLERLYEEYGATGQLKREHYINLGRVGGSIEAAVEQALKAADDNRQIPRDRESRLLLLRRGLIPWLASVDPETKRIQRVEANYHQLPPDSRPLIDLLVEQRLLVRDLDPSNGSVVVEPAHESILRQWPVLARWLADESDNLIILQSLQSAAKSWHKMERSRSI